jgi:hypothetical protein
VRMTNTLSMMSGLKEGETLAVWTTLPLWEGQTVEDGLGRGTPLSANDASPVSPAYPSPKFASQISTLPQGEGGLNGEASESGSDAVPATVDRAQSRLEKNRRKV